MNKISVHFPEVGQFFFFLTQSGDGLYIAISMKFRDFNVYSIFLMVKKLLKNVTPQVLNSILVSYIIKLFPM